MDEDFSLHRSLDRLKDKESRNDSLVMLTRYNQFLNENMPVAEALIKAGSSRFSISFQPPFHWP